MGVVFTFENCKKTALVVEKNTRVLHQVQKKPHGRGLLELAVVGKANCLCLCKKDAQSIIAVVVQSYLAGATQVYIECTYLLLIYLPPNFKVKIV